MRFPEPISIQSIAAQFDGYIIGDASIMASGINEIHKVTPGDITFSDVPKYFEKSLKSAATIILLNAPAECPEGKAIIVVQEPFLVYDTLVRRYRPFEPIQAQIHESAQIHSSVILEPGVVVGAHVVIGAQSYIQSGVYIGEYTRIGTHVQIGANSVIGTDAFYFKKHIDNKYQKWRSGGRTIIHDHVDIGAGCTINKGVSGDTVIGEGTKIDCQVHIGHGAVIGKHCLLAAQVGIAGKTILEDHVVLYGQVGLAHGLHIGTGAIVLAKSGVSKSLEAGKTYFGTPADEVRQRYKELAALRQLPDLLKVKGKTE
jgi:UDP-3-O-[3-hydroxymyristoyl] glucosamine N-acyltransferase